MHVFALLILWVWYVPSLNAQINNVGSTNDNTSYIQKQTQQNPQNDELLLDSSLELLYININDNIENTISSIEDAIDVAVKIKKYDVVAASYSNLGIVYSLQGRYDLAFKNFAIARSYIDQYSIKKVEPIINFNEGVTFIELSLFEQAEILLLDALEGFKNDFGNAWLTKYELTKIHLLQGDTTKVKANLPVLEKEIAEGSDQKDTNYLYHSMMLAHLNAELKQFEEALRIIEQIDSQINTLNQPHYKGIKAYINSLIEWNRKNYEAATHDALQAHTYFSELGESPFYLKTIQLLHLIHQEIQNTELAYKYLQEFTTHKQTVDGYKYAAISHYLKSKNNQISKTITLLEKGEAQLHRRTVLIAILIIVVTGLGVFNFLMWKSSAEKKKEIKKLMNLNADKNNFIGIVSHDLRSPLNSIMVLAEFMRDDPEMMTKDTSVEYGNIIFNSTQQMQYLLNNMLDVNRIESNTANIENTTINLIPIVNKLFDSISLLGKTKQISTRLLLKSKIANVIGNENAIIRVLENLLSNAYKFSPPNSTVTISIEDVGSQIQCAVTDQGPGLTESDKTKLFKKFEKLSATPTGDEKSTGLGLYIVKNLVQQMGGTILLESEQGQGTTFKVLLNKA